MKRVALITGGRRGIGLGIAIKLAQENFDILTCGVSPESDANDAVAQISAAGAKVIYAQADIADSSARNNLIDLAKKHFGRLDVLVNNAGVAPKVRADLLDATEESFDRVMSINLKAPYFLTQLAAKYMIEQKKSDADFNACIINIGSISAIVASINRGEYCLAKAGIGMSTMLWATRLGDFDIPVYEVRPGITETDMTASVKDKYDAMIAAGLTIQKRWGQPSDVAKAVASLARGDFPYSTGQILYIDGGQTLRRL